MVGCAPLDRRRRGDSGGRAARPRPRDPGARVTGDGPGRGGRLLAALLHVGADEVLGVLLQHVVDLVEDRVDVLAQLLAPLLAGRPGVRAVLVVPATTALALGLLLRHDVSSSGPVPPQRRALRWEPVVEPYRSDRRKARDRYRRHETAGQGSNAPGECTAAVSCPRLTPG